MQSESDRLFQAAQNQLRRGEVEAVEAAIEALLCLDAVDVRIPGLRAAICLRRGQPQDALVQLDRALEIQPDYAPTHNDRGLVLNQLGRTTEALDSFLRAAALSPGMAVAHSNVAQTLNALGRPEEALVSADAALSLDQGLVNAWRHRGRALFILESFDAALASQQVALSRGGRRVDLLMDLAMTVAALGQYGEALALFGEASAAEPTTPLLRYRRAFVRLVTHDFAGGWRDYEERWTLGQADDQVPGSITDRVRHRFTLNPTNLDLEGKRVLVVDEQGIGDKIMFASVLPDLAAVAAHVTCVVAARLFSLFVHAFPGIEIRAGSGPGIADPDDYDVIVALGSLPAAFRRSITDFPGRPYLPVRPTIIADWRRRLGPRTTRLRIGISWRGGTATSRARARSMDLEQLSPLLDRADCEFFNLQYGDFADEVATANGRRARPIVSLPPDDIRDFEPLAGLVSALDAVVTVQTSLAHLTGALGQTGLVMIPKNAEWRYGMAGSKMIWYDALRLIRQSDAGDWRPVIKEVGLALDGVGPASGEGR
mgnify:CR=1 FL=1